MFRFIVFFLCGFLYTAAQAKGVYQEPANFIKEVFTDNAPVAKVLWLTDDLKNRLKQILQHDYPGQRIRYWQEAGRSIWILDEIGKTKPITAGIVINHDRIEKLKVLVFRETRGWEVKHDFFTRQFIEAGLQSDDTLDRYIDGISGATLSVRALTKLARIALLLDRVVSR